MNSHIHVVVNPASGQERAPLEVLSDAFRTAGVEWSVSVTREAGDARRLTRRALAEGADVVAAYGGDGTVSDVASALVGTGKRLAVLPGGTANVASLELGIPDAPAEACALACGTASAVAAVDAIEINEERHVLLQAGIGLHAESVKRAQRGRKRHLGWMAYALSTLECLMDLDPVQFRLTLDDEHEHVAAGVACLVCNAGLLGCGSLRFSPSISMCDGLLDVLVIRQVNLRAMWSLLQSVLQDEEPDSALVQHWRVRTVRVTTDTPQPVQGDGGLIGETPFTARVLPGAVPVIVPETSPMLRRALRLV